MSSFVAIDCLINPEAIMVGGRLPTILVGQPAASLLRDYYPRALRC
ncbi:MAG TPA: hypothetical protein VGN30_15410 [Steroidobacteraceae bacterium]